MSGLLEGERGKGWGNYSEGQCNIRPIISGLKGPYPSAGIHSRSQTGRADGNSAH